MRRVQSIFIIVFCFTCLYYYSLNNFSDAIGDDDTIWFADNISKNYGALNFMNFHATFFTTLTWAITSLLNLLGIKNWGAINSLRFLSSLSGSLGVVFLVLLLQKIKVSKIAELIFPLILAVSLDYWRNSANGESFIPGLAAALITIHYTFLLLTKEKSPTKFIILGLFGAFAIGFRIDNAILIPLIISIIWLFPTTENRNKIKYCINYVSATVIFSFFGYLIFYFTLNSWQRMSNNIFYVSQHCNLYKYGVAICTMISSLPKVLINSVVAGFIIIIILLCLLFCALFKYHFLKKELQSVIIICLVWLGLFLFSYSWGSCHEPEIRAFYNLVPLLIISSIGYTYLVEKMKKFRVILNIFLCAIFFIIFYTNLRYIFEIRKSNYYQCIKCIKTYTDKNHVIIVSNPDIARIGKYYFSDKNEILCVEETENNFIGRLTNTIKEYKDHMIFIVLEDKKEKFSSKHRELSSLLQPKLSRVLLSECNGNSLFVYLIDDTLE